MRSHPAFALTDPSGRPSRTRLVLKGSAHSEHRAIWWMCGSEAARLTLLSDLRCARASGAGMSPAVDARQTLPRGPVEDGQPLVQLRLADRQRRGGAPDAGPAPAGRGGSRPGPPPTGPGGAAPP